MKHAKFIALAFAGYTILVLAFMGVLSILEVDTRNAKEIETINTLEHMAEWMDYDIQEGNIDSIRGNIYIENINQMLIKMK